jgi:signal transduction histidine kinase
LNQYGPLLLKIDFASAIIVGYFFLFFCLNFPRPGLFSLAKDSILILPSLTFYILSFSSLVIKNITFSDGTIHFERGILYWFYTLIFISYVGLGSLSLIIKLKKLKNLERIQTFYIILGFTLTVVVAAPINLLLTQITAIGTEIYRLGIYGILFFIIFTSYAIIKHHLMDIRVIATELLTGAVALTLFIDIFSTESRLVILLKSIILIIFVYLGISLVRSVLKEVHQREKMEQMAKELEKAYGIEKEARVKIQELGEAKTQFIMATQHHLRTPLTSMRGYIDLILTGSYGKVPSKIKNAILKLQISTVRLLRIVNELLDVSQFQLGKKVVSLQPGVQIEPILKEVLEELHFTAESKGVYLKLQKPEEKMPAIQADVEKLKVVLFNLIDNGIKYTNKGGVTIKMEVLGGKVRIISEDTGIGIPKERLGTLFDNAFERGQEAKKVFTAGRGIGLYVSSQIVKAHNGKVWAESEGPGKGTAFYIELPIS